MNRQLAELREFMDVRRIPKELRVRVRHYMELLCTTTTADTSVQLVLLGLSCRQPNAPPLSDTGKIPPGCAARIMPSV